MKSELPGTKKNVKKTLTIVIMIAIVVGFVSYRYVNSSNNKIVNSTIAVLNSAIENDGSKYITLQLDYDKSSADYTFQFYEDGRRYIIANSENADTTFTFESVCDTDTEYVKSSFTSGFEILGTTNCNEKTFNINDSFSGFDLTMIGSGDFEYERKGNKTYLTAKKEALTSDLFLGNYAQDAEVEVKSLVITTDDTSTSLKVELDHSILGSAKITLTVIPSEVLELPEYK